MIITVANWKGGVGKTTLAIAIADAFVAVREARVSLVDLDPQSTASQALLGEVVFEDRHNRDWNLYGLLKSRIEVKKPNIRRAKSPAKTPRGSKPSLPPLNAFRMDSLHFVRAQNGADLSLYPNSPKLWDLEADELGDDGGLALTKMINMVLKEEAKTGRIVIVDCPPGHSVCTLAAIRSSDIILCPMTLDRFAFWAKRLFSDYIAKRAPQIRRRFVVSRYSKGGKEDQDRFAKLRGEDDMLWVGSRDPAVFSERSAVQKRIGLTTDARRRPREMKDIYGSELADQLKKIVNAIFKELEAHG